MGKGTRERRVPLDGDVVSELPAQEPAESSPHRGEGSDACGLSQERIGLLRVRHTTTVGTGQSLPGRRLHDCQTLIAVIPAALGIGPYRRLGEHVAEVLTLNDLVPVLTQ